MNRILETLGLDTKHATGNYTPAQTNPLTKDKDGPRPKGSFSYSRSVGMMRYLSGHSHPGIAYAVNLCVRYMFSARLSQEKVLKRISRYLKATRDRGLIMTPSGTLKVDAFPDADFDRLYGCEKPSDLTCSKSRTRFLISLSDSPVLRIFKLQRETVLLTIETEVNALACCCCELFSVIGTVGKIGKAAGLPTEDMTKMHVFVHKDNSGALILAKTIPPQFTPRSKYYFTKTVRFREKTTKRRVSRNKIDTKE